MPVNEPQFACLSGTAHTNQKGVPHTPASSQRERPVRCTELDCLGHVGISNRSESSNGKVKGGQIGFQTLPLIQEAALPTDAAYAHVAKVKEKRN